MRNPTYSTTVNVDVDTSVDVEVSFTRDELLDMLKELDGDILAQESGDELKRLLRDIEIEIMATQDFAVKGALTWVKERIEETTNA
ncbi:hypothetical protein EJK80_06175 [Corynebacterium phoceense]|uniref:Uncharacterized protein n=1 Tax=Corynebacterium phoceense TaxID=1686286 RepID=A0A540R7A9_9CORY|nr:hypothetical protein [Corynebacterium phoceense]TQE43592.1 hypothetical protein EJK80_06175 [Corynebacterium phoceense]